MARLDYYAILGVSPQASDEEIKKVYDALLVDEEGVDTTLEVQQQLGDGVVRTIALGSTDGLTRGLTVSNTGAPISVPVGEKTLGRIMNVLGQSIDELGDIGADEKCLLVTCGDKRTIESLKSISHTHAMTN